MNKLILAGLLFFTVFCYKQWLENYKYVDVKDLAPETFAMPVKTALNDTTSFVVKSKEFDVRVEPKYKYTISGIVLRSTNNNSMDSLDAYIQSISPVWIMFAFSDKLRFGTYKSFKWRPGYMEAYPLEYEEYPDLRLMPISATDKEVFKKLKSIAPGDQVIVKGLVAYKEFYRSGTYKSSPPELCTKDWTTVSEIFITKADDIKILRRASRVWLYLFWLSGGAFIILLLRKIFIYY